MKKFLIIALVLLSLPVQAQEAAKNQIYEMSDFSGGQNSKLSPFSLPKNQGDIAQNVRFDTQLNTLTKRDEVLTYGTASASSPILGMHRFYLYDGTKTLLVNYSNKIAKGNDSTGAFTDILTVTQSDRRWQWLTWHNIAIGTDGYNQPVKYDGSSSSATYLGSALALDAGSGAGPNGEYTYKITCYTASTEYSFNVASNTITVSDNDINLSMIPICPDSILGVTVTGRKVYRTEASGSTYKLLSNGTIADNTTVTLTDSDADGALGTTLSPTANLSVPKGKLLTVHNNRLFIANNPDNPSYVYYSEDGSHEFFFSDSILSVRKNDGDEITCLKTVLGKLTVCKNNTIQKIYTDGDDPATEWEISDPFSFVGCHAMYSVVNTSIGMVYLSNNGIYNFNGQYSELLSDPVTPDIRDISSSNIGNTWGEYFKNSYYLTYTSSASGSSVNNRVMILDLLTKAFSIDTIGINVFHVLRSGSDVEVLYSGSSANGNIYAHNESLKEIVHRRHSDFTGTFTDMRYIPTDAGGDAESPIIELARTATIDALVGTIDALTGTIDRSSTSGTYVSQVLTVNASEFDKVYWNETLPQSATGDVLFAVRSATNDSAVSSASWSSDVSNPSGSDISSADASTVMQYRITMTTGDLAYTPTIYKANNFNLRITYNIAGATDEDSVPFRWRSGWMDLGYPGYKKTLRKIYVYYESESTGTLNVQVENYGGQTDTFAINMQTYPSEYVEYFANGAFLGELFRIEITEDSLNSLKVKKIICIFDVEPLV